MRELWIGTARSVKTVKPCRYAYGEYPLTFKEKQNERKKWFNFC